MKYTFQGLIEIPDLDDEQGVPHVVEFKLIFKAADDETADTIFEIIAPNAMIDSYEKEPS